MNIRSSARHRAVAGTRRGIFRASRPAAARTAGSHRLRGIVIALATVLATTSLTTIPAANAAPSAKVMVKTQRMAGPELSSRQLGWYNAGATLSLKCYSRGQAVSGYFSAAFPGGLDNIWYKTSDNGFVADVDINTNTNNPVAPACTDPFTAAPIPTISGARQVGQLLRAVPGTFTPAPSAYSYQWLLNGAPVSGATAATWTLPAAALNKTVSVSVTASRVGWASTKRTSATTALIQLGTIATVPPVISGSPAPGQVLSTSPAGWRPAPSAVSYQWRRNGANIPGATGARFTVSNADLGKDISVAVSGTAAGYRAASALSAAVRVGVPFTAAPNPTISGTPDVGQRLNANTGAWKPAATFRFQWLRNGAAISGATGASYVLTPADALAKVSVRVTGAAANYQSTARSSAALTIRGKLTTATPFLAGAPTVGQSVTAIPGSWGPAPVTLSYQWLRNGVVIPGASGQSYRLSGADNGALIVAQVTGSKAGYTAASVRTAGVRAAQPSSPASRPYKLPFPKGKAYRIMQGPAEHAASYYPEYNKDAVDFDVPEGSPVVASAAGKVYFTGYGTTGEIQIRIDHGQDTCSQYVHLSRSSVSMGQSIKQGQLIGYSGSTGIVSGPHLHWNVVSCSNLLSKQVPDSLELGTNYIPWAMATSRNG